MHTGDACLGQCKPRSSAAQLPVQAEEEQEGAELSLEPCTAPPRCVFVGEHFAVYGLRRHDLFAVVHAPVVLAASGDAVKWTRHGVCTASEAIYRRRRQIPGRDEGAEMKEACQGADSGAERQHLYARWLACDRW